MVELFTDLSQIEDEIFFKDVLDEDEIDVQKF